MRALTVVALAAALLAMSGVAGPAAGAAIAVAQNHPAEPDVPAWVYVAVPVLVVAAAAWWAARRRP